MKAVQQLEAIVAKAYPLLVAIPPDHVAAAPGIGKWSQKQELGHLSIPRAITTSASCARSSKRSLRCLDMMGTAGWSCTIIKIQDGATWLKAGR